MYANECVAVCTQQADGASQVLGTGDGRRPAGRQGLTPGEGVGQGRSLAWTDASSLAIDDARNDEKTPVEATSKDSKMPTTG